MVLFMAEAAGARAPNPWSVVPFAVLLLAIAGAPFAAKAWWEHHYRKVALGLGLVTAGYYLAGLHDGARLLHTGVEYAGFIVMIGALFVVAGGIHLGVPQGTGRPFSNTVFLAVGAVLANVVGTTGASMLLIRPWIRLNQGRVGALHIVFFIFLVGNVGGCLTPVGDPPLFLGYLKHIPFFWTWDHLREEWALAVGILLGLFLMLDLRAFALGRAAQTAPEKGRWHLSGGINFFFLAVVLGALFLPEPWRELAMAGAALASYWTTSPHVHQANGFTLAPIEEVAWLFAGIFVTMMPAIDLLQAHAAGLGIDTPGKFYWITGSLSALLDNAPTYLAFLTACLGLHGRGIGIPAEMAAELAEHGRFIAGISVSAVFFGAMTYIGNGPNFMVKAIAEEAGVPMPGFFGYLFRYAVPLLLPVLLVVWLVFFR